MIVLNFDEHKFYTHLFNLLFCFLICISLSSAAASSLGEFTVQSSTGMQYLVDNKSILDVCIDLKPSYVIIPENGVNDG